MADRTFAVSVVPVNQSGAIQNNCNAVSFYNAGNTLATVQGVPILPLQGWTPFEPVDNGKDITNYIIVFNATGVASPVNNLLVIRKDYQ